MAILVGLAGGYLIYRRADAEPAASGVEPWTGRADPAQDHRDRPDPDRPRACPRGARRPDPVRARAAGHDLVARRTRRRPGSEPSRPAPDRVDEPPIATTLIVERSDTPQGVAVGLGELERLSSGQVMTLRAPRPALRVVAGTGPLLLSSTPRRNATARPSELLDETGLGPDGKNPRTA